MLLLAAAAGALVTAVVAVGRPGFAERVPDEVRWVAAAGGAVALALADTAPTGWEPFDLVLRAGFGALVPLAAARAGTVATAWLTLCAAATVLVAVDGPALPAGLALGIFLALAAAGSAVPGAAAVAAALAVGSLGHVDWPVATGASAGAAIVATTPVLLVGWARSGRPVRGRVGWAVAVAGVVLVAGSAAGLLAAFSAESDITRAVDLAGDGIDLLGDDDVEGRRLLLDAAGAFRSAEETLTTWWGRAALLVPGVAQQSRAVSTMASAGADLARTAAEASEDADVDSVRPVDGRIDLTALAALADPLDRSVTSLRRADARLAGVASPLLLEPVADRLTDLRDEVTGARDSAELASQVVGVAPKLLGADGPRRYFVAFQNPSELRGNGGFIGNWAEVVAEDGLLTLTRNGRSRDLFSVAPTPDVSPVEGEEEAKSVYGDDVGYWVNVNFSPDHPTVSRLIAQLYPKSGGAEVDGVIALTPAALSGFLELTGPIEAPGYPDALTSENAERVLLFEQYLQFPQQAGDDREEFLAAVVEILFDRLTSGELPGPRTIAEELGPAVAGRDLQMWASDPDAQALFATLGADGDARREQVDSFGVVTQNFGGNKIDWFLRREVVHDVQWDPGTGEVSGTLSARVHNDAPAAGLPSSIIGWGGDPGDGSKPVEDGENFMMLTLYSTFDITEVTVDGEPVSFEAYDELGHRTARIYLSVPSQSVREVVASIRGVVDVTDRYTTRALRQPTAQPDELRSRVRVAGPWTIAGTTGGTADASRKEALTSANASSPLSMTVNVTTGSGNGTLLGRLRGAR